MLCFTQGQLEIFMLSAFAASFARPPTPSRARRVEDGIPLELLQEYTVLMLEMIWLSFVVSIWSHFGVP